MLENRTTGGPPFAWGPSKPRRLDTTIAWGLIRLHPFILDKSGTGYSCEKASGRRRITSGRFPLASRQAFLYHASVYREGSARLHRGDLVVAGTSRAFAGVDP